MRQVSYYHKLGPMWHIHARDHPGSIERTQTQDQAITFVIGILAARWACSIEMLVYDEQGRLEEAYAVKKGECRKLDLTFPSSYVRRKR